MLVAFLLSVPENFCFGKWFEFMWRVTWYLDLQREDSNIGENMVGHFVSNVYENGTSRVEQFLFKMKARNKLLR